MAVSGSFKVPSVVAQDLAMIMAFVDPPEPAPSLQENEELARRNKHKCSPNIVSRSVSHVDDDISSSCTESEDEVEAEIAVSLKTNGAAISKAIPTSSEEEDLDSQSSSSESSSSETSFRQKRRTGRQRQPSVIDADGIEDGPPAVTAYFPTAHEIPPSAIPVPSLPDPSSLPQEALGFVGEIVTILPDSLTVRGGNLSSSSARERKDAVLNEGSLLLLNDRTPLGYVSETFGPTTLPHYLVRFRRRESAHTPSASPLSTNNSLEPVQAQTVPNTENNSQPATPLSPPPPPSSHDYLDPTKIFVSRAVYHIPSLSKFVFSTALANLKGSDASNLHDEEIPEHEQEFSDDEAEAMHRRLRRRLSSRSPSEAPFGGTFDGECEDSISVAPDEAGSLYGTSPYDAEDGGPQYKRKKERLSSSPSCFDPPAPSLSLTKFEDAAVQDALALARNSRHRRHTSVSISEASSAAGPSQAREQDHHAHGRGRRGRARGKDRPSERGRDRNPRGQARSRGHRRGPGATPELHDGEHVLSGNRRSSFSFEEYDPHMPRPPSPTSLAIARATGQWADGTPFPYNFGATSGGSAVVVDAHVPQATNDLQGQFSINYSPEPYGTQGFYGASGPLSQTLGYQPLHVGNFGVAPHINPRFAQAFQPPNSTQRSFVTPQNGSFDTSTPYTPSEPSETEPGVRSDT